MIEKVQSFLKRIRWKAFFFDNTSDPERERKKSYGFKSEKSPPQNKELLKFENAMYNMIKNIKFNENKPSDFQCKLSNDMKEMKKSNHLYIPADKTTNIYKVSVDQYRQLLHSNITANYKKADAEA